MNDVNGNGFIWPSALDYDEAIQNMDITVRNGYLRQCAPIRSPTGLPRVISGNFASVYECVSPANEKWAVRCLLSGPPDQHLRYRAISTALRNASLAETVEFEYIAQGILVNGAQFPLVKVAWVDGVNLDRYVHDNVENAEKMRCLEDAFERLITRLRAVGIAHGDLQHGNILVTADGLKLVDYDAMFVPALTGMLSYELGHRNYQHPHRAAKHFGSNLDHFSSLVIQTSLRCLRLDPSLLSKVNGCDDCLLFREGDFRNPDRSSILALLDEHPCPELRETGRLFRRQLAEDAETALSSTSITLLSSTTQPFQTSSLHHVQPTQSASNQSALQSSLTFILRNILSFIRTSLDSASSCAIARAVTSRVSYNPQCCRMNPLLSQLFMLVCPFTWAAVMFLYIFVVSAVVLPMYGEDCVGKVLDVQHGRVGSGEVMFEFRKDRKVFTDRVRYSERSVTPKVGEGVIVRVGPAQANDPFYGESCLLLKQRRVLLQGRELPELFYGFDLLFAIALAVVLICVEIEIWREPIRHLILAAFGRTTHAVTISSWDYKDAPSVQIGYVVDNVRYYKRINLNQSEFDKIGVRMRLLYLPSNPARSYFYDLCHFVPNAEPTFEKCSASICAN